MWTSAALPSVVLPFRPLLPALLSGLLALHAVPLLAEEAPAPAAPCPPADASARTMTRTADFVVLQGSEVPGALGLPISHLSLLARDADGKVLPIPFQVDEINAEGEWILPETPPEGRKASAPPERDEDDGRLDANDQLVFMLRDAGGRIPPPDLPADAVRAEEITLTDPIDGGRAWVTLCAFSHAPPLSDKDYVAYDFSANRVVSQDYELGFSREVPVSWDHLSFRGAPNMMDRLKIRFDMKILGIRYRRNETHFRSEVSSYKDGPVRVIRRVRSAIKINRLIRTPSAASESIYYDNAVVIPYRIKVPVSMKSIQGIVKDVNSRGGADMQNLHGWKLKVETDDRWFPVDGKMDDTEKNIRGENATWFVLSGPPGAFVNRIILDRKWDGSPQELPIATTFYYTDDDQAPDPPEFVPGQSPHLGFLMDGMENLEKGTFYFYIIGYMIKDYHDGMEIQYLDIMDRPVERTVRTLRKDTALTETGSPGPGR